MVQFTNSRYNWSNDTNVKQSKKFGNLLHPAF